VLTCVGGMIAHASSSAPRIAAEAAFAAIEHHPIALEMRF